MHHTPPPRTIVVRAPNWLGDQILAYPFFYHLRHGYPAARITVACVPWVAAIQFRDLVDDVCVLPPPRNSLVWAKAGALEAQAALLRARGPWELGICLPNAFAAAWLFARAHVRWRRGYNTDGRGWLLHDRLRWAPWSTRHRAAVYAHLLPDQIRPSSPVEDFWKGSHGEPVGPANRPVAPASFDAGRAWPVDALLEPPPSAYWVLAPGSMATSRRWPVARFAALARHVAHTAGLPGLVVGGTAEAALAHQLCQEHGLMLTDLTARGPVAAYWPIFQQALFTVSNDSGLAHVAALCGSPVYIVWGAGSLAKTQPLGPGTVRILQHPVACWPCERNVCHQPPPRTIACLQGIEPEAVWRDIQQL